MALATLNSIVIVEATVTLPRSGRWSADVAIASDTSAGLEGQPVTIDLGDALNLKGTCRKAGTFAGSTTLEVVGGTAGLLREVPPKAFQECELGLPLTDVLTAVGETLAATSDTAATSTTLPKWVRIGGATAAEEVAALVAAAPAGTVARVLPDGTVWVGVDQYLDSGLAVGDYQLLRDDSHRGIAEIGVEQPSLLPGTTFLGRQVEEVVHTVTAEKVRTTVQFATQASSTAEPSSSSHTEDLDAIILRRLRPTRFYRVSPATVAKQNADGTLELVVDDTDVPGLSSVPVRTAGPGVTIQVPNGTRCGVEFENGNPQAPVVTMFAAGVGVATSYSIGAQAVNLGPSAAHPVLLGDTQKSADDALDAAIEAAYSTLAIATTAITTANVAITATGGVPTPGSLVGPALQAINAALLALGTALNTAAAQHTSGRAAVLSAVTQTA
jgi:hypothetical protein